jgi:valyl-tRNA synthetase
MNMGDMKFEDIDLSGEKSVADKWILTRLNETIETVTKLADKYEFGEVGRALYNFIWDDFCDWYIEMAKLPLYGEDEAAKKTTRSILAYVLDNTMRLLHPFMPFITEEIWQQLPHEGESITVAKWPEVRADLTDKEAAADMRLLVDIIRSVRNVRAEVNTPMSKQVKLLVKAKTEEIAGKLEQNRSYLERFCNPSELTIGTNVSLDEKAMTAVVTGVELILPLQGLINIDEEIARLQKELAKLDKEVERVQKKLSNQGFIAKAPESVIEEEKAKEKDYVEKREAVQARIDELKG